MIPHAPNARTHSEEQPAQIAGSITKSGFVNPILVGDDEVLVAGHGRVLAERKLGLARFGNFHQRRLLTAQHLSCSRRLSLGVKPLHGRGTECGTCEHCQSNGD